MLVPLRFQSSPAPTPASEGPQDALRILLECHERIRALTDLAVKVARLPGIPAVERVEAVTWLERYFTVGLPRHIEDEDVLLSHALWESGTSMEVLEALETMSGQHRDIETLLHTLLPRWHLLRSFPERHEELEQELARDSTRLAGLMEEHLELEERVLYPEARARLSPEQLVRLGAEMRARRGTKP
jgi:hemerythrin-like domain-containing protein